MAILEVINSPVQTLLRDVHDAWDRTVSSFAGDVAVRRMAWMLLAGNVFLILMSAAVKLAALDGLVSAGVSDELNFARDWSVPEMFNYLQSGACAVFLFLIWRWNRSPVYLAWAAMFTFILLDDSLQYHETVGGWLVGVLGLHGADGLRGQDFGEILAWLMAAAILVPLAVIAAWQAHEEERGFAILMGLTFVALVFCGVFMDMLHQILDSRIVTLFEDGGEMLSIAAACILAFAWYRGADRHSINPAKLQPFV